MKKKLFALALVTSLYSLFIIGFGALDNQGKINDFFTEVGLSNQTAFAASDMITTPSFKSPAPKPEKPKPKPDPDTI